MQQQSNGKYVLCIGIEEGRHVAIGVGCGNLDIDIFNCTLDELKGLRKDINSLYTQLLKDGSISGILKPAN